MLKELLLPCDAKGCLTLVSVMVPVLDARQRVRDWLNGNVAYQCPRHRDTCSTT